MEPNNSNNKVDDELLDEFDISSIASNEIDNKEMAKLVDEFQKLKAEYQQFKETNSKQFGELWKEMDELKSANCVEIQAFDEFKMQLAKMKEAVEGLKAAEDEEKNEFEQLKEEYGKSGEENAELMESIGKLVEENVGMKEEMDKLKEEFAGNNAELEGLKEEMSKLKKEFAEKIAKLNEKMGKFPEEKKADNAATNLTGGMEFAQFKNSKWNAADCGHKLVIFQGDLVVKHNGPKGVNCIRAVSPIPSFNLNYTKASISGYYEVKIIRKDPEQWFRIQIGFCTREFPLEGKWLGAVENSIGMYCKAGMDINGQFKKFENDDVFKLCGNFLTGHFKLDDVIGIGIVRFPANSQLKCFATWNGQLLGTIKLPHSFATVQLFPAVNLATFDDSVCANFGQEAWKFDASQLFK